MFVDLYKVLRWLLPFKDFCIIGGAFLKKSKNIICLLLVLSVLMSNVQQYKAMGVSGVIGGGGTALVSVAEAFAWLLGVCGIVGVSSEIYENIDSIKEFGNDCIDDFSEFIKSSVDIISVTVDDVTDWISSVASGVLDTASDCFVAFKMWVSSIYADIRAGVQDSPYKLLVGGVTVPCCANARENHIANGISANILFDGNELSLFMSDSFQVLLSDVCASSDVYLVLFVNISASNTSFNDVSIVVCSAEPFTITVGGYSKYKSDTEYISEVLNGDRSVKLENGDIVYFTSPAVADYISSSDFKPKMLTSDSVIDVPSYVNLIVAYEDKSFSESSVNDYVAETIFGSSVAIPVPDYGTVDSGVSDIYDRDNDLDNLSFVPPLIDVNNGSNVPIDWENVNANGGVAGVLSDVNAGTNTYEDLLDISDVIATDTSTDTVVGNDITDVPITDVQTDVGEINDYTLDLTTVFPFCLPFDLYDFVSVLCAEPTAPNFTWVIPLKSSTFGIDEEYEFVVDLSAFDDVMSVVRDMELFAFIVGLIIATRSKFIRA